MKKPTEPGVYWVSLDDGGKVVENVLLQVRYYSGATSFDDGAMIRFLDGSGRMAELSSFDEVILKPYVPTQIGFTSSSHATEELRVKWLTKVVPPKNAPEIGSDVN